MVWLAALQTAGAWLPQDAPGVITVSPRLAASAGAAFAGGLLLLIWSYRRRPFILTWMLGWLCVAAALFLTSEGDAPIMVPTTRLAIAGAASVISSELFLVGLLYHEGVRGWRTPLVALAVTAASYAVTSGLPPRVMFAATFVAMAGIGGFAAAEASNIARRKHMVGGLVIGIAFVIIVLCTAAAGIAALGFGVNLSAARFVLITNSACYTVVAFGQMLFVFEDMMLELRDSNRELLAARAELHHAAITDSLTSLYNRRLFDEVAAHQLEHHRRFHLPLSLVYIDIDRFKTVNDTRGHDVGDRLLQHVAGYLRSQIREADYVFRLGGDEFLILISCSAVEAEKKARDLQGGFAATLRAAKLPETVALSVGVTELPPGSRDIAAAVQHADAKMYADKRQRASAMAAGS